MTLLMIIPLLCTNFYVIHQLQPHNNEGAVELQHAINIDIDTGQSSVLAVDTAIIITSSWIPSHPSTRMIDTVINSIEYLVGLPKRTPIFITIDGFPDESFKNITHLSQKMNSLDGYTTALFHRYLSSPHMHIIPGAKHSHIGGSVFKAMTLVQAHYPSVQYIYYLQHDFSFVKEVDHMALADVMTTYPNTVNYIRFKYEYIFPRFEQCGNATKIIHPKSQSAGSKGNDDLANEGTVTLVPTNTYSDNNHFVRFEWYFRTIASISNLRRPPEFPLQIRQSAMCKNMQQSMGLFLYDPIVLRHLNGREKPQS